MVCQWCLTSGGGNANRRRRGAKGNVAEEHADASTHAELDSEKVQQATRSIRQPKQEFVSPAIEESGGVRASRVGEHPMPLWGLDRFKLGPPVMKLLLL